MGRNHASETHLFPNVVMKMPELRQIGAKHQEHLNWFRSSWSRLKLPPLFAEIFDIPKCEEDLLWGVWCRWVSFAGEEGRRREGEWEKVGGGEGEKEGEGEERRVGERKRRVRREDEREERWVKRGWEWGKMGRGVGEWRSGEEWGEKRKGEWDGKNQGTAGDFNPLLSFNSVYLCALID